MRNLFFMLAAALMLSGCDKLNTGFQAADLSPEKTQ